MKNEDYVEKIEKIALELFKNGKMCLDYARENLIINDTTNMLEMKNYKGELVFSMCLEDVNKNY